MLSIIICLIASAMTVDLYLSLPDYPALSDGLRLTGLAAISFMSFIQIMAVKTG